MKKWIEYRRNKKIVKRELAKIAATTLPLVSKTLDDSKRLLEIGTYIMSLSKEDIQKILVNASVETMNKEEK